jgi:biotin carboxylase
LLPTTTYRTTAFVEAARRLQIDLIVASEQPSTFEQARPDGLITLDFGSLDWSVWRAQRFAERNPFQATLGVDDDTVVLATAIDNALGHGRNPLEAVVAARDKHLQRTRLAGGGVHIPKYALHVIGEHVEAVEGSVPYPCVVKPLRLSASKGVIRADDRAQLREAIERVRTILESTHDSAACADTTFQYLVEEFVSGYEIALEGLLVGGELHVLALFDKPDPLDGPFFEETIYVTPSRHPEAEQAAVIECARQAAAALGLREGPIHAELRFNEQGAWLIELAARPIGGRCSAVLRFGDGSISLEEIVLRHALGMPLPSLERERSAAAVMMIPVPGAGVLEECSGVDDAKRVPGVDDVVITAHRGETLVPWPEGSRYPGFIFARGATPALAERAVREAHRRLRFVIRQASP